jgi:predicted nucleotidyltransferase
MLSWKQEKGQREVSMPMNSHNISTESLEGELLLPSSLSPAEQAALEDFVDAVRGSLGSEIIDVQLFGSKARGDAKPESDVDVLVVVRRDEPELIDALYDLLLDACLSYNVYISLKVFSEAEYERLNHPRTPFMQNVAREGMALWR